MHIRKTKVDATGKSECTHGSSQPAATAAGRLLLRHDAKMGFAVIGLVISSSDP